MEIYTDKRMFFCTHKFLISPTSSFLSFLSANSLFPPPTHPFVLSERSPASGEAVGCGRTKTGGGAAEAQIRHLLCGLLSQRQVHCQRGEPAWHDGQRLGMEGTSRCHVLTSR